MKVIFLKHNPYRYRYIDFYDHKQYDVFFKCPVCDFDDCVNVDNLSHWESKFKCLKCGSSSFLGKDFNYYGPCFIYKEFSKPVQLQLF